MEPVLFLHNYPMPFVLKDLEILSSAFRVREFHFRGLLDVPRLLREVRKSSMTFSWFGGFHSFWMVLFSRLLGKPSLVVAGGYDVASYPEIRYGAMRGGPRKWMGKATFGLAQSILSVSPFNYSEILENVGVSREKVRMIPLGIEPVPLPQGGLKKKRQVTTVGVLKRGNLKRKGLLTFVEAARFLPKVPFFVIGKDHDGTLDYLRSIAPSNVEFLGYLSEEEKDRFLWESKVYAQVSYHEAFGVAVAEAMLRGSIPVVTRRAALTFLVGDSGIYVENQAPDKVARAIKDALESPDELGLSARERILRNFTLGRRKKALLQEVSTLLNGRKDGGDSDG